MNYKKNCNGCGTTQIYSTKYQLDKSVFNDTVCKKCAISDSRSSDAYWIYHWKRKGHSEDEIKNKLRLRKDRILSDSKNPMFWEIRNLSDVFNKIKHKSITNTLVKTTKFWIDNGFSNDDAIKYSTYIKCTNSNKYPEYWEMRGESISSAKKLANKAKSRCSLTRENLITRLGSVDEYKKYKSVDRVSKNDRYPTLQYFKKRGITNNEADYIKRSNNARCVEYWIKLGYDESVAKKILSGNQDFSSKKYYVNKYGNKRGNELYEEKSKKLSDNSYNNIKYWNRLGFSDEEGIYIIHKNQSKKARKQRKCVYYWLNIGYTMSESKKLSYEFAIKTSSFSKEFWINRGYNINDAKKIISDNSRRASLINLKNMNKVSKMEYDVYSIISNEYLKTIHQYFVRGKDCTYCCDFYIPELNLIVEFFGDSWHMNPEIYTESDNIAGNISFSSVHLTDRNRINELENMGYDVLIIWENDVKQDFNRVLKLIDDRKIL